MITIIVGLITIVVAFHFYYSNFHNYWKNRGIPYYLKNNAYLNLFQIIKRNIMYDVIEQYMAYPDKCAYGVFLLGRPHLMIKDPSLIREICIKDYEHFTNHQDTLLLNDQLLRKMLFFVKDQKWRNLRTILTPVFTGSKLRELCELISDCGDQTEAYYIQLLEQQNNEKLLKVDMFDASTRFANDVIASTAFGIKVNSLTDKENEFYTFGQKATTNLSPLKYFIMSLPIFIRKMFYIKLFNENIYNYFRQVIRETIRIREEQNINRPDMVQLLLEARHEQLKCIKVNEKITNSSVKSKVLSIDDITAQGFFFFMAGYTNVAMTIAMTVYEIAVNPEIQKKTYAEIQEAMKGKNGKVNYEVIKQLQYMEMVISETLRKWSPLVVTDRVCNKAFKIDTPNDDVINVEPEMALAIPISGLHNDPKFFPNPDKFDPERFSEANKSKIIPYTYQPFGVGPRACIANRFVIIQVKIFLCYILKTFEVVTTDETPIPMVLEKGGNPKPKNEVYGLALKKRN